ncbi:hypothetical protein [Paenarthrobacter nicotinovorans]|uniref:hypothetical protein n=1 Tax=Paenarthrobacter nicotinovorans TaxID=29320 RepID=UPI00248503EC|nr:hypothetical protein [Paenarthrobacter nicotinovorans]MDI2022196.1 hypothetical protein [Paenarthrobacter nicotinovorans]
MLAIVCPGQGSQTPGFLAPWLELPSGDGLESGLSAALGAWKEDGSVVLVHEDVEVTAHLLDNERVSRP